MALDDGRRGAGAGRPVPRHRRGGARMGSWLAVLVVASVAASTAACATSGPSGSGGAPPGDATVVFRPVGAISAGALRTTVDVLRRRLAGAGVPGAQVASRRGTVVVELPAHDNRPSLVDLLGSWGQLLFRPVLCDAPAYRPPTPASPVPAARPLPSCGTPSQLTPANLRINSTTGEPKGDVTGDPAFAPYPSTPPSEDTAGQPVLLPGTAGSGCTPRCVLGPAAFGNGAIASASSQLVSGTWVVNLTLTPAGSTAWDQLARRQFHAEIGLDLGGTVISAPLVQPAQTSFTSFDGRVEMSGDFTRATAHDLAFDLDYGSLPAPLELLDLHASG